MYSTATSLVREEKLQSATNYNYLAAEYLLPNNGYIHLANASHLAGPSMNTFEPSLDFRVRDRSNGYECAGTLYLSREQIDTNTYQGNRLNLSIGRINRRWGWRLSHNTTDYPVVSTIRMPSIRFANSRAEVQYRSFTPKYGFLNTTATGGVQSQWSMQEGQQTLLSLYANMRVLDRKFRTLGLGLSVIPYEQTQRYQTGGAYLNRKLAPRLEGSLDVASDQRKRLFWSAHLDGGISTRRELPELNTELAATWVFHPRFSFKAGLAVQNIFEFTYLLPAPGRWLFERRNEQKSQLTLDLNWYATRSLGLFGGFGWYRYKFSNREALEIQPDGQLEPVAYELPILNSFSEGTLRFGFQYFFKDISQIRFSYGLNPDANFFEANIGPFYPNIYQRADLSMIWLLGNTGKR
ncbi:MAG: hypothetical protein IT260_10975 [Saprospiraceae bacterium]|nr:hypothetical protein [Saprospiraceae bacterium]